MSNSHKGSNLFLSGKIIPVDNNTTFLAHYDITNNDVLHGIEPIGTTVATLRPFSGYFGGGIAVEEDTTNYVGNGNLEAYTNGYNPAWDSSLNGNLKPSSYWSTGYNSGVTSANIGYHAHLNIDKFGYPVLEYIDMNGQFGQKHRWLGFSQQIATNVSGNLGWQDGTEVTYSFDMMTDGVDKGINLGLYHRTADNSGNTFGSTQTTLYVDKPYEWERKYATVTLKASEWDFTKSCSLYVYGNYYKNDYEGIGWVRNVQVETKGFPTSFIDGSRLYGSLKYPQYPFNRVKGTVSLWFNSSCINQPNHLFYIGNSDGLTGISQNNIEFYISINGNQIQVYYVGYDTSQSSNSLVGGTILPNTWYMASVTWSIGGKIKLFLNGKKISETDMTLTLPSNPSMTEYMYVGSCASNIRVGNSIIDELRVDKIERTEEEIEGWYISNQPFYPKGVYRLAY